MGAESITWLWEACRKAFNALLPMMNTQKLLQARLATLASLGTYMLEDTEERRTVVRRAEAANAWFTVDNSMRALTQIAKDWLNSKALAEFVAPYRERLETERSGEEEHLALVLAGNVPLVGLHDVLCAYIAGLDTQIKLSDKDAPLMRWCIDFLRANDTQAETLLHIVEQIQQPITRVIATGSDNSALYFEQYFGKYPNIIRRNRNSIAVLTGNETEEELMRLGADIFRFFGLGCRSVSKIFVPKDYDFQLFMRTLDNYRDIINHLKYCNNFEYNRSIYLINSVPHLANDCLMVLENASPLSRIATLHYERYDKAKDLQERIKRDVDVLQCAVCEDTRLRTKLQKNTPTLPFLPFGSSQSPRLQDFADNIDTLQFLLLVTSDE